MAGEPAPLAAVQAATLKVAAAKKPAPETVATGGPSQIQQDLSVMADLAKGYTEGINAGVINEQNQRNVQGTRLAEEKAQADAMRADEDRMLALKLEETALARQAQSQDHAQRLAAIASDRQEGRARRAAASRAEAEDESAQAIEDALAAAWANREMGQTIKSKTGSVIAEARELNKVEAVRKVRQHLLSNTTGKFSEAVSAVLADGATNVGEAMAYTNNIRSQGEWKGLDSDRFKRYVTAFFDAQKGRPIDFESLNKRAAPSVRSLSSPTPGVDRPALRRP